MTFSLFTYTHRGICIHININRCIPSVHTQRSNNCQTFPIEWFEGGQGITWSLSRSEPTWDQGVASNTQPQTNPNPCRSSMATVLALLFPLFPVHISPYSLYPFYLLGKLLWNFNLFKYEVTRAVWTMIGSSVWISLTTGFCLFVWYFFFRANGCIEFTGKRVLEREHIHQSDASKQEHTAKIEEYSVPSIYFSVFILIAF